MPVSVFAFSLKFMVSKCTPKLYSCLDLIRIPVCLFIAPADTAVNCPCAVGPIYCRKDYKLVVSASSLFGHYPI